MLSRVFYSRHEIEKFKIPAMSSIRLDASTQPEELAYIHLFVVCWRYLCKALDLRQVCSSQQATPLFESPDHPRMLRT